MASIMAIDEQRIVSWYRTGLETETNLYVNAPGISRHRVCLSKQR